MSIIDALILGIIQGLTEFLPISSSGHLVLAEHFLNVDQNALDEAVLFFLILHLGTVLAVVYCYWKDIVSIFKPNRIETLEKTDDSSPLPKNIILLFIISIAITGIIGLPINHFFEEAFSNARMAASGLIITSAILALSLLAKTRKNISEMNPLAALIIGIGQGIAVFPGISRSGTTIVTGMLLGYKGKEAARYTFILSVPTILLANGVEFLKKFMEGGTSSIPMINYIIGFIAAAVFGVLAIKLLVRILGKGNIAWFAIYCLIIGIVVLMITPQTQIAG